jgi:hypothetical protein
MGTSASLRKTSSPPAFLGIGERLAHGIAGQYSGVGGRVGHPGEERLYQGLGFGQPDILLFGPFQSPIPNLGFQLQRGRFFFT